MGATAGILFCRDPPGWPAGAMGPFLKVLATDADATGRPAVRRDVNDGGDAKASWIARQGAKKKIVSDLAVACGGVVTTSTTRARTKRPHCDPNLQDGIAID